MLTHDIMDHWEAVLPPGRIMRVPYEALVQAQEATTRRILDFVGLDWEPEVLQFHATARAVQTASLGQVRQRHRCICWQANELLPIGDAS